MATQGDNDISMQFAGVSPDSVRARPSGLDKSGSSVVAQRGDNYSSHIQRGAASWFFYAYNRQTGKLTDLSGCVESFDMTEDLESVVITGSASMVNAPDERGVRVGSVVGKGTELRLYVKHPISLRAEERGRFVVLTAERTALGKLNVTFADYMWYLQRSKVTMLYQRGSRKTDWTVGELTRAVCKKYGVRIARMPKSSRKVPYFYQEEQSLLDVLIRLWTLAGKTSGVKYRMTMQKGRLVIASRPKNPPKTVLELSDSAANNNNAKQGSVGGILVDATRVDSIEDVVTAVRLRGTRRDYTDKTTDTRKTIVASKWYVHKAGVAAFGRVYFEGVELGVTDQKDIEAKAKKKLGQLYRGSLTATYEIVGFPFLEPAMPVRVNNSNAGLNNLWWVKSMTTSVSGDGTYTCSGDLVRSDYIPQIATEPSDLKPDNPNASSGSVSSKVKKTSPAPQDVWLHLRAATKAAGVPESWANSKQLAEIIQFESSYKWTAQNPRSTAYGLFQFLNTTWAGTGVPKSRALANAKYNGKSDFVAAGVGRVQYWKYWMCVAGLRYIKNRYKTPAKARAFQKKNGWY